VNAKLPNLSIITYLLVIGSSGCEPQRKPATVEEVGSAEATPPVVLDTFEVLEVRGKVRGSLNEANPRVDAEWFKIRPSDLLLPDTFIHIPFRGRLKVSRRTADPRTVILLENGQFGRLNDLVSRPRGLPVSLSFSFGEIDAKPIRELPCHIVEEDRRGEYPNQCWLHKQTMPDDFAPIEYGLIRVDPGELPEVLARQSIFPNSNRNYRGGCVVRFAKEALIRYCPKCREAESKWRSSEQEPEASASQPAG
jgi:hypothetical protein